MTLRRKSYLKRHAPLRPGSRKLGTNRKRKATRFARNYGSLTRVLWFKSLPCVCEGLHPACYGETQNSHTRSKAVEGDAEDIIPQSAGCHDYVGSRGWRRWELEVGAALGLGHRFVVECVEGPRFCRVAAAAHFAGIGPDAPGVSS
jgi:hypothetical protein